MVLLPQHHPLRGGKDQRPSGKWDRVFHVSCREGRGERVQSHRGWLVVLKQPMTSPLTLLISRGQARGFGHKRHFSRCCMRVLSWWYFVRNHLVKRPALSIEKILSTTEATTPPVFHEYRFFDFIL